MGERAETFISKAGLQDKKEASDGAGKGCGSPALPVTSGLEARALGLSLNWEETPTLPPACGCGF